MKSITIGDVVIASEDGSLFFSYQSEPDRAIRIDHAGVPELMEFLRSVMESEINQRKAFRVPILRSSGLEATLHWRTRSCPVTPLNLSLIGMFIETPDPRRVPMRLNEEVQVALELESDSVVVRGVVLRHTNVGYGIFFPDCVHDEEPEPPAALGRIVMELQRRWIATRAR